MVFFMYFFDFSVYLAILFLCISLISFLSMHKIIAPLILLSSLTLLTSCMDRDDTQIPTVKPQKESPVEVDMVTAPIATGTVMTPTPQAKVNPVSSGVLARSKKISYMSP